MAKKKSKPRPTEPPRRLLEGLAQADELMSKKRWREARTLLEELSRRYPDDPDVLGMLVNTCYEINDIVQYQYACERLHKLDPDDADLALALAGAYMVNYRLAHAMRAFQEFLQRWPDHDRAAEARETLEKIQEGLDEFFNEMKLDQEKAMPLALKHESLQSALALGHFRQGIGLAQEILSEYPNFAPAYNNLSQLYWAEGQLNEAIVTSQQILSFDAENVHALANLARYFLFTGKVEDARAYAEQLKLSTAPATDRALKICETLSYLGDDQGVLDTFKQAEECGETLHPELSLAMLYHLVAVAACRQGDEKAARNYWKKSLEISEGFQLAARNLEDMRGPIEKRHAPWAYSIDYWLSPKSLEELQSISEQAARKKSEHGSRNLSRRFLEKHPEILSLATHMLDRGDEMSREFVLILARTLQTPELLEAVKDFALRQRGPDHMRLEAAQVVSEAGLLPTGLTRMWVRGEWIEILLLGFEIHDDYEKKHSRKVEELAEKALGLMHDQNGAQAEALLLQALEIEPEAPDLLNNLAAAYEIQGRRDEAFELIEQIHQRFPDYLFGCTGMAQILLKQGETKRANELLMPLLELKRLHYTEFDAICAAFIELHLAEKNHNAARSWFGMWESADPENPKLGRYRVRLGGWKEWLRK